MSRRFRGDDGAGRGIEFGWRVHAAQESWTAKVDAKAAIVFTVELALLAGLVSAHAHGHLIDRLHHSARVFAEVGTAFAVLSVVAAGAAVIPRLGRTHQHMLDYRHRYIYFGHLRLWDARSLADRLSVLTEKEELDQLSSQLVEMSRRNWSKHVCLQIAVVLAFVGAAFVAGAVLAARP